MVGGKSRVPLVREMVQRFVGDVPVYSSVDLELAVATGAVMGDGSREEGDEGEKWSQLGEKYYNGDGVERDYREAVKWYRKAAEQGNIYAQNNLGSCYYYGNGVLQDYEEAVKWYQESARQGMSIAQNFLGDCYLNGKGVSEDYGEAVKWYQESARQGYPVAQNNLGNCYKNGWGVSLPLIHFSETTRLLSISYAVCCLKKKNSYGYTYIIRQISQHK